MNGIFINPSIIQKDEKAVERFCTKMNSLFDKMKRVDIWQHLVISDNMKKVGLLVDGLDIDVDDYLEKILLLPHDYLANVERMADFVCCVDESVK